LVRRARHIWRIAALLRRDRLNRSRATQALETLDSVAREFEADARHPAALDIVQESNQTLVNGDDPAHGVCGIIKDITERKSVEAELRESEERFRRLSEAAFEGIAVHIDGLILDANQTMARMLGRSLNELIGAHALEFVAPESQSVVMDHIRTRSHTPYEARITRGDSTVFTAEICGAETIYQGTMVRVTAIRDITDRKRAEVALRESHAALKRLSAQRRRSRDLLRALVHNLDDGLVFLDKRGRVLVANAALAELLGRPEQALLGRTWAWLCRATNFDEAGLFALETLRDGQQRGRRTRYTGANGLRHVLEVRSLAVTGAAHAVEQLIIQVVDITERVELEEMLIQNERLAASGRLAATIAHEINTPLQAIRNLLHLAEQDDTRRESYLALSRNEIARVSDILSRLLGVYRSDTNACAPVDLNAVVEQALLLMGSTMAAHNIDVVRDLAPMVPRPWGHANHISQVLLNLLLNAVDAMPDGGTLHVETLVREAIAEEADAHWQRRLAIVAITDTGVGITDDVRPQLFTPFFTTKANDSGLGLPISQRIARQHGGRITVRSVPGAGSTFSLELPLDAARHGGTYDDVPDPAG
jgi:PAS domain S-box-containing protein